MGTEVRDARAVEDPTRSEDDRRFYWDWVKHEDILFVYRGTVFVVGESMLFTGAATLLAARLRFAYAVFCGLGLISTAIWLWVNYLQQFRTHRPIKSLLAVTEHHWLQVAAARQHQLIGPHTLMGLVLPVVIIIAWLVLLVGGFITQ